MSTSVVGAIPLDLEIIAQVAFRYRRAEFALPTGWIERFRVRSPAELEHAVDEIHAAVTRGILEIVQRGHD